jgi:hypothetical protein
MKMILKTIRIIVGFLAIVILGPQAVLECEAHSTAPYIPYPSSVTISPQTTGETVSVKVNVDLPDTCCYVGDWGQPMLVGNSVYVDAQFWVITDEACAEVITPVWTNYDLGMLSPGNYNFVFEAWGTLIKTQVFLVPVRLSIRALQAESQVQLCWNTATSAWYRVEYCSTLATNEWVPLTAWLPGTGNWFCTNDAVLVGQDQKFYRVAGTNAPPP